MGIFDKLKNKGNVQAERPFREGDKVSGIPFAAYRGKEPYMFISYAHVDSPKVYPIISEFNRLGYNVWYDEGIEPGIEWPEEIANALGGCSLFVVFITPQAAESVNVRNEINFALQRRSLPFIAIYLKQTTLTPGLQLQMGTKQAILQYNMDDESFRRKYCYSFETVLKPKAKRTQPEQPVPPVQEPDIPKKNSAEEWEWTGSKLTGYHGNEKEVTLPSKATVIYSNTFKDNPTIEKIVIPVSVSHIDFAAFDNCPNLRLVIIEGGYVTVGENGIPVASRCPKLTFQCHQNSFTHQQLKGTFSGPVSFFSEDSSDTTYHTTELTVEDDYVIEHGLLHKYRGDAEEVRLPEAAQIIGGFAFKDCQNLRSVIMSDACGAVLDHAFVNCPNLENITIGKSFSSLAKNAFSGCPNVKFTYYRDRIPVSLTSFFWTGAWYRR